MSQSLAAAGTTARPAAELALTGDLHRPARLTVPDLPTWPQHEADVSFECATSGMQHHRFTGPLLHDVPSAAGPAFDPARRKDRLRFLIAVSGTDGHHALLSWAEIDPDFGRAQVLLAVTIDDAPLDHAGPQLVLPQDRCGARHISRGAGGVDVRLGGGATPVDRPEATNLHLRSESGTGSGSITGSGTGSGTAAVRKRRGRRAAPVPDPPAADATGATTRVPRPSHRCGRSCGWCGSCRRPAWWWCRPR